MSSTSLLPIHTSRKLGWSSPARLSCDTELVRSGSPRIRNLSRSRPATSSFRTMAPATSPGAIRSKTLAVSSPGTARFRTRRSGEERKPMGAPAGRRTSPGSRAPFWLSSKMASWGGTPGPSMSGWGSDTCARRARIAGALSTCPARPVATRPPELKPARRLSPTTTSRRSRADGTAQPARGIATSRSTTPSDVSTTELARFKVRYLPSLHRRAVHECSGGKDAAGRMPGRRDRCEVCAVPFVAWPRDCFP